MIEIDIFLIYTLQIWKRRIKSNKNSEDINHINKEDFLASDSSPVHFNNHKKGVKPKSPTTIKRESNQGKKTHRQSTL